LIPLLAGIAGDLSRVRRTAGLPRLVVVLVTYVSVLAIFRGVAEIGAAFTLRQVTQTAS
jgi:hypothetical protein